MIKKEYDIFISYRRENGEDKARILNQFLSAAGYRVFFDHEAGMTGEFETEILAAVEIAPVFLMLLTPHCFDRCVNDGDWVSREIERAMKLDKHIIPIRPNYDFEFTMMPAGIPDHVMRLKDLEFAEIDFHKNFKPTAESMIETMIKNVVQPSLVISNASNSGARIHLFSDISCRVLHYGIPIAVTDAADTTNGAIVRLLKGRHKLEYKSIEHEEDAYSEVYTVPDNDYEDFINIILQPIKDQRKQREEEQRIAEEKRAAEEKERRALEESKAESATTKKYKYDFFFSYSRKDAAIVRRVQYFLQNAGYSCWIDMDGIAGGMQYQEVINDAIEDSKCVIFFHSENSSKSQWAINELMFAINEQKKILPILIDQTPITDRVALYLGMQNFFDLTDRNNLMQLPDVARRFMMD